MTIQRCSTRIPQTRKARGHSEITSLEREKRISIIWKGNGCSHLNLDDLFIKTADGCIMKCADCKRILIKHCPCTMEEAITDVDVPGLLSCAQRRAQIFF